MSKNALIVLSVINKKMTVAEAAKNFGVTRAWVYQLLKRHKLLGSESFKPRSRAHHRDPNALSDEMHERIAALRSELIAQGLDAGAGTIQYHLRREFDYAPALSTIWRSLRKQGLVEPTPKKKPKLYLQRFEAYLPNETWQSDFTHIRLKNGADILVLNFLDDHSRFLISCTAHRRITSSTVVEAFTKAGTTFGYPQSSLTDNGLVFTSRMQKGRNAYEILLERMGIEQKNSRPNHPQTQGKIERFHQTLKKWLAARTKPTTVEELQALLDQFRDVYNNHRPHRALNGITPALAYSAKPKAAPSLEPGFANRDPLHNKVDSSGKVPVRLNGRMRHIGVGRRFKGRAVYVIMGSRYVMVTDRKTGEILSENKVEPALSYWKPIKNPDRSLDL